MNARVWRAPFQTGEAAPGFECPTPTNQRFNLYALGGHYTILSFVDSPNAPRGRAVLDFIFANQAKFSPEHLRFFAVLSERPEREEAIPVSLSINFFMDYEGKVASRYQARDAQGTYHPYTLVLDHMLRVVALIPIGDPREHNQRLAQVLSTLPRLAENPASEGLHAPVLVLPRVFEPEFCRHLIAQYEQHGGEPSGYMREVDGKTMAVLNSGFKRRSDFYFHEGDQFETLRTEVLRRLTTRLLPQIEKAFQFKAARMERFVVARYSGEDEGFFRAHRDNTTPATKHRRFACTINLNAEDFEGGELRFPEFGQRSYRAPTGGAVVFSCSLLHEALPVTRGNRYAFLPFFYTEEDAKIRTENASSLSSDVIHE